jgi:hypothetical protein
MYLAAEIARARHGSIEVSSSAEETRFTFQIPLDEARPGRRRLRRENLFRPHSPHLT